MEKIIIEVNDEMARKAKLLKVEIAMLAQKALQEKFDEMEKIERFKKIVAKSKATEEDAEELSDEINTAMWAYHRKKYNL